MSMCIAIVRKPPCELNNVYAKTTTESRASIWYQYLRPLSVLRRWSVVVDLLFFVAPIVCGVSVFGPCLGIHYFVFF